MEHLAKVGESKIETLLGINSLLTLKLNNESCKRQVSMITTKNLSELQMLLLINIFTFILTVLTVLLLLYNIPLRNVLMYFTYYLPSKTSESTFCFTTWAS